MSALKPSQIAKQLAVSVDTVLRWIRSGELKAIDCSRQCDGKPRWRVTASEFEDFQIRRSTVKNSKPSRRPRKRESDVIEFY